MSNENDVSRKPVSEVWERIIKPNIIKPLPLTTINPLSILNAHDESPLSTTTI